MIRYNKGYFDNFNKLNVISDNYLENRKKEYKIISIKDTNAKN